MTHTLVYDIMWSMAKIIDLTGQKFFRLEAIKFHKMDKNGQAVWECKCDCGNSSYVRSNSLRRGATKSCGCWRREKIPPNKLPPGEAAKHRLYSDYKRQGKYVNRAFELSYNDFIELTQGECVYCGRPPSNIMDVKNKNYNGVYIYNGIDRVDSTKGYVEGNCVSCCEVCNRAKKDMTLKDFKLWIIRLVEKNK